MSYAHPRSTPPFHQEKVDKSRNHSSHERTSRSSNQIGNTIISKQETVNTRPLSVKVVKKNVIVTGDFLLSEISGKGFSRKGSLKNFTKFTGKHLRECLIFHKVPAWGPLLKKETGKMFCCEICEIFMIPFFIELKLSVAAAD